MRRFTKLFNAIDRTTRTSEKTAALKAYFEEAPAADAVWALRVLTGQRLIRAVPYPRLRAWAAEAAGLDAWLFQACYDAVGDLSETLALVLPPPDGTGVPPVETDGERGGAASLHGEEEALHTVIETRILPLAQMTEAEQRDAVRATWGVFDADERFLFHKLISGNFRVGAARKVVINALAQVADVEPAVMQHRLGGRNIEPTAEAFAALLRGGEDDPARPYPFYLAYQLDDPPATLGSIEGWRVEWKWDGIRAQLIRRGGETLLWSRGDELITGAFPELRAAGDGLADGTVLDGEVLAWDGHASGGGRVLPFGALQRRLNRKGVQPMLFADTPVVFMAYDLLEHGGKDQRERSTDERRATLETLLPDDAALRLSPRIDAASWEALAAVRGESRERGVEGVMLKRADAPYAAGRVKGDWWKWKVDPYTVDCVMVYAQRGSGRRSSLFTDYTFAVWAGAAGSSELVPVTKAYSGLTDAEFAKVDAFIKRNTEGKQGGFRAVRPELVFEIAFEGINASERHKSGVALRFPRMHRWRTDKKPIDADTLGSLMSLLKTSGGGA